MSIGDKSHSSNIGQWSNEFECWQYKIQQIADTRECVLMLRIVFRIECEGGDGGILHVTMLLILTSERDSTSAWATNLKTSDRRRSQISETPEEMRLGLIVEPEGEMSDIG
jgi:hypothetical protein